MKKKYFIILVDILTIILIILHAQALSLMIIERFQYYSSQIFFAYMLFYYLYGIIGLISESDYKNIFLCLNFLIYILNIIFFICSLVFTSKDKSIVAVLLSIFLVLSAKILTFSVLNKLLISYIRSGLL